MNYQEILSELGFRLTSHGNSWKTNAIWRGGDNRTAICIYKDTGVWIDYVSRGKAKPFAALLKEMGVDPEAYDFSAVKTYERSSLLKEERIFKDDCLGRLLPDYSFFQEKEKNHPITVSTQKIYQTGLATKDKLYNRMVFPIRNRDGKIHGFTGRDVTGKSNIKWLHNGKSTTWLYPYYTIQECRDKVKETGKIILVESIGDSMACFQSGYENTCVTFTNRVSPRLVASLSAMNVDVIVAMNNDLEKPLDENAGIVGGVETFLKMYREIDLKKLWFMPPNKYNDFGEAPIDYIKSHFDIDYNEENKKKQLNTLFKLSRGITIQKTLEPVLKKLKREYQLYE